MTAVRVIANGTLNDSTEVMYNDSFNAEQAIIALINNVKSGSGSFTISTKQFKYEVLTTGIAGQAGTTANKSEIYKKKNILEYDGGNLYDTFPGVALDTTKWSSTGAPIVADGYCTLNTGTIRSDGSSPMDFKAFAKNVRIRIECSSAGGGQLQIKISGASDIQLVAVGNALYEIFLNYAAGTATVYDDDGTEVVAATDISTLANWYLKFVQNGGGTEIIYQVSYIVQDTTTTTYIYTTATTATSTITAAILHAEDRHTGTGATIAYALSADNGSNYEDVTIGQWHKFTTTGTQLKLRVTIATNSASYIPKVASYGILYAPNT